MTEKIIGTIFALGAVVAFFFALNWAWNDTERQECEQWTAWINDERIAPDDARKHYPNWAIEQCKAHNIPLNLEN